MRFQMMFWACVAAAVALTPPRKVSVPPPSSADSAGVRLNKCLVSLSRRAADAAIAGGRVSVDGAVRTDAGFRCVAGQSVRLDGAVQKWAVIEEAKTRVPGARPKAADGFEFIYIKYWKPKGVTCTSDRSVKDNIIDRGGFEDLESRVFTVGRLDKDSSGLILLTSDGRLNNAMLRPSAAKQKRYVVELDRAPTDQDVAALKAGVVITTTAQRDRKKRDLTARTQPCEIARVTANVLEITLQEGRNRQIRKMVEARGLDVRDLHRTSFAGINLEGLRRPGDALDLSKRELALVRAALADHDQANARASEDPQEDEDLQV